MNTLAGKLEEQLGKRIATDESLVDHTVLKRTAIADLFVSIDTQDMLVKTINAARSLGIPVYILGSGARIDADGRIKGLVIKNNCRRFDTAILKGTVKKEQIGVDGVQVYAQAGTLMNQLVRYTLDEGLAGLEYQLGLPGTVGGAIATNAKYEPMYLQVTKALQSVTILGEDGKVETYSNELPYFVYTDEPWQETKDIILSAVFKLTPSDKSLLWKRGEEAVRWREAEGKKRLDKSRL